MIIIIIMHVYYYVCARTSVPFGCPRADSHSLFGLLMRLLSAPICALWCSKLFLKGTCGARTCRATPNWMHTDRDMDSTGSATLTLN